jgi:hypothetical protein
MHRYASASAMKWHRYGLPYVTLQVKEASMRGHDYSRTVVNFRQDDITHPCQC